jgi:dihydroorotase
MYDALLKDARVIDPSQGVDGILDVAITDGKIEALEADIPQNRAKATIPLAGKIVTPGLIDAHCHPVGHFTDHAVSPDEAGVHAGVLPTRDTTPEKRRHHQPFYDVEARRDGVA